MAAGWFSSQQVDDSSASPQSAFMAALLLQRRYPKQQNHARDACIDDRESTPDRCQKIVGHHRPHSMKLNTDGWRLAHFCAGERDPTHTDDFAVAARRVRLLTQPVHLDV